MNDDTALSVAKVDKDFLLPHEKTNSLKSTFLQRVKGGNRTVEKQHALRDISFEVKKGEFFGIVGRNGSGKSTLLKILAQIYQPTSGDVKIQGKLVPFIELGVGFNAELTGKDNVYLSASLLGFTRTEISAMYNDIVDFAELRKFMDQKLKNYSSGMQVRLAFSIATRAEADILLVDEVLAVGDADFQRKCFDHFRKLKKENKTVVFVSHDMSSIREYCDRAILIENSELILEGETDKVATAYTRMFMDSEHASAGELKKRKRRWGNNKVELKNVSTGASTLSSEGDTLTIKYDLYGKEKVERPVVGYIIKNASGVQLMGTNNKLKKKPIQMIDEGQTISIEWQIPNVFNDGEYTVDVAVSEDNGSTCDWWEEALSFRVYKEERAAYLVTPSSKFTASIE